MTKIILLDANGQENQQELEHKLHQIVKMDQNWATKTRILLKK